MAFCCLSAGVPLNYYLGTIASLTNQTDEQNIRMVFAAVNETMRVCPNIYNINKFIFVYFKRNHELNMDYE